MGTACVHACTHAEAAELFIDGEQMCIRQLYIQTETRIDMEHTQTHTEIHAQRKI